MKQMANIIVKALDIDNIWKEEVAQRLDSLGINPTTDIEEVPRARLVALETNFRSCEAFLELRVFQLPEEHYLVCLRILADRSHQAWDFRLLTRADIIQAEEFVLIQQIN